MSSTATPPDAGAGTSTSGAGMAGTRTGAVATPGTDAARRGTAATGIPGTDAARRGIAGAGTGGTNTAGDEPVVLYHERLGPPLWWAVPVAGMAASVAVALAAAVGPGAAAAGAAVTLLLAVVGGAGISRAVLEVRSDGIRVDRAVLPFAVLTAARALTPEQAARLRGADYDPRGWYRLRGWIPGAVLLTLADPVDPTTFWYVSSRTPELAVAAVARAVEADDSAADPAQLI